MNKFLRKITDRILGPYLTSDTKIHTSLIPSVNKGVQILLSLKYQELLQNRLPLPKFADVEFRAFSQNGEDGILLYIFSLIGMESRVVVEICAGVPVGSNSANLIINHGWNALLFEGDERMVKSTIDFYAKSKDTFIFPPQTIHAWITKENVNQLISAGKIGAEIDLLSIDVDGVDYWLWKEITAVNPRVVMVEYHEELGTEPVTVPYSADFDRTHKDMRYFGASLPAFVKLAREKGYRLVGSNHQKFNAFFVRNDIAVDLLPEVSIESCMRKKAEDYTLLKDLKDYPFEHV